LALDDQASIKPVFDAARDCFHAPGVDLNQGFVRQTYTSNVTRPGPMTSLQQGLGSTGQLGIEDSTSVQTSVAVCQPVDSPVLQDTIGALTRLPAFKMRP
jgi:hypothetical protein